MQINADIEGADIVAFPGSHGQEILMTTEELPNKQADASRPEPASPH
jgi:hypothetical protein